MNRYSPAAAAVLIGATLLTFLSPTAQDKARADVLMVPEGGRLDALDAHGHVLGPCPLKHTDVDVEISGRFARITLVQRFQNPYPDKIEAVYTFPMSHRAAVDRMTMTIGDRVIVGEVHERQRARAIYEAAKARGHVASLLEQERSNIFTQSVANIEPSAEVLIEISYVELLESEGSVWHFDFPMVVGPRYTPGRPTPPTPDTDTLPAGLEDRYGLILLAPAELTVGEAGDTSTLGPLNEERLRALIDAAKPIVQPDDAWWTEWGEDDPPQVWHEFEAVYPGVSREFGTLYTNRVGQLGGRWFAFAPRPAAPDGTGFARGTDQVPDAGRITPIPTRPQTRAGHDISINVTIDTGGPGITNLRSTLHEISITEESVRADGLVRETVLELANGDEIPNRDFILTWEQVSETITESVFTHVGEHGGFFTLILQPPDRVADAQVVPRELVFVLDTSGSMSGLPINKAKETMAKAIDGLREDDTFNVITFAGDTHILWDEPKPGTWENIAEAQNFLASREGGGGTEMMTAINAALVKTHHGPLLPSQLANLPADGRAVVVRHIFRGDEIEIASRSPQAFDLPLDNGSGIPVEVRHWSVPLGEIDHERGVPVLFTGRWVTKHTERVFEVELAEWIDYPEAEPVRIVCFMTDGCVGNDMAIIDAIQNNAATTRVFSFGIGNGVNRYLLAGMARAGRGSVDFVPLSDDADVAVDRFLERIQTPVLTDIELEFSAGLDVAEVLPNSLPDLHDHSPLVIHGRYGEPGVGTLTIRGNAGDGPYERVLNLQLPESQPEHDTIATLWARARVEDLMNEDLAAAQEGRFPPALRQQVVELGETFGIMTQFTSFVAVENLRLTVGGQPRLVTIPIELPEGVSYEGIFGQRLCDWAQDICISKTAPRSVLPPRGLPSAAAKNTRFVQLQNARADEVAKTLNQLFSAAARGGGATSQPVTIRADTKSSDLIVSASSADMEQIAAIIEELDKDQGRAVRSYSVQAFLSSVPTFGGRQINIDNVGQNQQGGLGGGRYIQGGGGVLGGTPVASAGSFAHPYAQPGGVPGPSVDMWSVVRANNAVPKQFISPSTTRAAKFNGDYDFAWKRDNLAHVSYSFQYTHDPNRRIARPARKSAAPLTSADNPARLAARIKAKHEEIARREANRLERTRQTRQRQVEQLMDQAGELRKEHRLGDADEVLKQVLAIDPNNEQAAWMKETLEDLSVGERDRQAVEDRHTQAQELFVENDEAGIPWNEDMRYPKNWEEVSAKRRGAAEEAEPEINIEVRRKLRRRAPELRFDAKEFEEVLNQLRALTGLNIHANWTALEASAIEKDAEVTLDLRDVTYEKALRLILDEVGAGETDLAYDIEDGVIQISTKEDLSRRTIIKVYNVQDLLIDVPTFRGLQINIETIIDFIQETIDPESWREAGGNVGSIQSLHQQLVITQSRKNHEQISELLTRLERSRDEVSAADAATPEPGQGSRRTAAETVREGLQRTIPTIKFDATPFEQAIERLGEFSDVELVVNWPLLEGLCQESAAEVSLQLEDVTVGAALKAVLAQVVEPELDYEVLDGAVFVSTTRHLAFRRLMGLCAEFGCLVDPGVMFAEQLCIHTAALHADGRANDARRLAEAVVEFLPEFKIGVATGELLANQSIDDEQRREKLGTLRRQAEAAIDGFVADVQTVARRVDERLLPLLMGARPNDRLPGVTLRNGGVVISVLIAAKDQAVLDALQEAGLAINSVAQSANVVAGLAPLEKITDIALVDAVRKVEPID